MVPFVGPAYTLKRKKSDVQRSVNLMPTPIESGSGKSAAYLAPVPGLVMFSAAAVEEEPGGGGGVPSVFMANFQSHSCNYGFFPRPDSPGFLLVTDTFGADRDSSFSSPEGWYLKLQLVNADGSLGSSVASSVYVTNGICETYFYEGFIYAGFVIEIATLARCIVKIDPDSLAVTKLYEYTGPGLSAVRVFDLIADPSKVMFNTFDRTASESAFVTVDLDTGLETQTVTLPYLGEDFQVGHVSQEVIGGPWFVGGDGQFAAALRRCNLTTGAVIDTYSSTTLFGADYRGHLVKRAGAFLLVFSMKTGDLERCLMGVFDTTTNALVGSADIVGRPHELDFPLYDPVRNTVYFVATEETVNEETYGGTPPTPVVGQARVYGYSLDTFTIEFDQQLPLAFADGQPITAGSSSFTGSVSPSGNIYVSHFTGSFSSGGFGNEIYKVFTFNPP